MTKVHLTSEFCEREYNARAAIPEHPQIFRRWKERSEQARMDLACHLNIPYGPSDAERLDLFFPAGHDAPVLMLVHGGYWQSLDKSDFSFLAPALVQAGATVAVVNYALCPAVRIEDIVRQMLRASVWLWKNVARYGGDPARLFMSGHSAGGHLAAMLLAADWPLYRAGLPKDLVKGGLSVSGLFDLEPLIPTTINAKLGLERDCARLLSPISYRPATRVPLYLAVGEIESSEFHRQSELLRQRWREIPTEFVSVPGCHHLGVIEQLAVPGSVLFRTALKLMGLAA